MRASLEASVPFLAIAVTCASAVELKNPQGIGRVPAMGWNSWNEFACNIDEDVFLQVSDLLIKLGLKDAGYTYVNIDDC
jgi:alpha-galactosidase